MTAPSYPDLGLRRLAARATAATPGLRALPGVSSAGTPGCPGAYGFAGEVDIGTTPVAGRVVRLYDRASGRLLREVTSDSAGLYAFSRLTNLRPYYIVALDSIPSGRSAAITDYQVPS